MKTSGAVWGAVEGGRRGKGRGRIRRTGLTPDWLGWLWRKSQLRLTSQELSNFSAAPDQGSGALDRGGGSPAAAVAAAAAPAANNSCYHRRRREEGREEEKGAPTIGEAAHLAP